MGPILFLNEGHDGARGIDNIEIPARDHINRQSDFPGLRDVPARGTLCEDRVRVRDRHRAWLSFLCMGVHIYFSYTPRPRGTQRLNHSVNAVLGVDELLMLVIASSRPL